MKSTVACIALCCALISVARAQHLTVEQFKRDQPLQDSIITAIVSDHSVMSKLISKVAENPHLHEMVIQHLTRLLNEKSGNGN